MRTWLGLLAAPTVVLAAQSTNYALIQLSCVIGTDVPLHVVSAAALLFSLATAWLGWQRWRRAAHQSDPSYVDGGARAAFLSSMAMLIGAFCALVQLMMWVPQWWLPACR
jgi:uncharacterized membrane protein YidH (DUF202 family)